MEEEGVQIVEEIARTGKHDADRLKAVDLAAKYGELTPDRASGERGNVQVNVLAAGPPPLSQPDE